MGTHTSRPRDRTEELPCPSAVEAQAEEVIRDPTGPGSQPSPGPPSHIRHRPDVTAPSPRWQARTHFPPWFYNQTQTGPSLPLPLLPRVKFTKQGVFSLLKSPPATQHSSIHRFRKGLRLRDNPALLAVATICRRLHPLFILEPSSSHPSGYGGSSPSAEHVPPSPTPEFSF